MRNKVLYTTVHCLLTICLVSTELPAKVIDDFEDGDTFAEGGWEWRAFSKPGGEEFVLSIDAEENNKSLLVSGMFPDDGSGFTYGGLVCAKPENSASLNLCSYWGITFLAAGDTSGYYSVRLEQDDIGYNSSNVIFPVTETMERIFIPIDKFQTGCAATNAITFTRLTDVPGETYYLRIDDVAILENAHPEWRTLEWTGIVSWAPSLEVGWQDSLFENKPMLVYFGSQFANPCRRFESLLVRENRLPSLANQFVMAKLNVNDHLTLARRYEVMRVPSFLVFEPTTGENTSLYIGADPQILQDEMEKYLTNRKQTDVVQRRSRSEQYSIVTIDNFDDRNDLNQVGGVWATFSAGDQGDIQRRFTDLGGGNLAIEAVGKYPIIRSGQTWGGIYCDLAPARSITRDISGFRWLSFICRSDREQTFQVHLESGPANQSPIATFTATTKPTRVTIPISGFGEVSKRATTIVWTQPNPLPGQTFHLTLDDVTVIR